MGWWVDCLNNACGEGGWAENTVALLDPEGPFLDAKNWICCPECGGHGYIKKSYKTQEGGKFEPYIRKVFKPKDHDGPGTYKPFAFLYSEEKAGPLECVWFYYYKDTRATGGSLKVGAGPGGMPVFAPLNILELLMDLIDTGMLSAKKVCAAVRSV